MISTLESQAMQYLSSRSKQSVHAIRLELIDILDQKKTPAEGLSNAINHCDRMLQSDDLQKYCFLGEYAALLRDLLDSVDKESEVSESCCKLEVLVKGLNPFEFTLQSLASTADLQTKGMNPLDYPANELRKLFNQSLIFPEFTRPGFEGYLSSVDSNFWSHIKKLSEQQSASLNSLLIAIERFYALDISDSGFAGAEEQVGQFRKEVASCVQQLFKLLDNSAASEKVRDIGEAVDFLRNVLQLIAPWIELLVNRQLTPVQKESGNELIKALTSYQSESFSTRLKMSLLDYIYFLTPVFEREGFGDTLLGNDITGSLGIVNAELRSIHGSWQAYYDSSLSLSIPDLDAINALAESISDFVQSIKDDVAGVDIDSLPSARNAQENQQLVHDLKNKLSQLQAVARFVPQQCGSSVQSNVEISLHQCENLYKTFSEESISRFADSLLAIESGVDGLLEVNQSNSSMAALFVQVKALINQLEVSYRRCAAISEAEFTGQQGDQIDDELKKLSANKQTLSGVAGFVADSGLKSAIAKIVSAVDQRFYADKANRSEISDLESYDALMLECIEKAQIYTESLLKPGHSASIDIAAISLAEIVKSLDCTNDDLVLSEREIEDEQCTSVGQELLSEIDNAEIEFAHVENEPDQSLTDERPASENNKLSEDIDDEIAEIFLEEAEEVFVELESLRQKLDGKQSISSDQVDDWESLKECRRFFHTLKGSGRMACAVHLGEFGWALESMLNRILEGSIDCESAHIDTISAAISQLPPLLNAFRQREHPENDYLAIEENARGLAEGKPIEPALATRQVKETEDFDQPEQLVDETCSDEASLQATGESLDVEETPEAEENNRRIESIESKEKALIEEACADEALEEEQIAEEFVNEEQGQSLPLEGELPEEEPEEGPQDIFASELTATVASLRDLLQEPVKSENALASVLKAAVIKMHGLSGSAKLIDFKDAARVAQIAENHLEMLTGLNDANDNIMGLIESYCDLLYKLASLETPHSEIVQEALQLKDSFEQGAELEFEKQSVRETIQACQLLFDFELVIDSWRVSKAEGQLYDLLVCELGMLREALGLPTALLKLIDRLNRIYSLVEGRALNYVLHGNLMKAHEELENGLGAVITEQPLSEPVSLTALDKLLAQMENEAELATASKEKTAEQEEREQDKNVAALEAEDIDQEILAIFLEELDELEDEISSRVNQWRNSPEDLMLMDALLRPLHTLKGSARMAGVQSLANEAHALESNIQELLEAGAIDSKRALELFETRFAELLTLCKQTEQLRKVDQNQSQSKPVERRSKDRAPAPALNQMLRLPASMVERLCNLAAENNVSRAIVEQHISDFGYGFEEIECTLTRLAEQIRRLEIEAEAQIAFGIERAEHDEVKDFDPLEMDRYSKLQQISRSLVESCSDLRDLHGTLKDNARSVETALVQQSRIGRELHVALQQTRTVPLSKVLIPRVRKTLSALSKELAKPVSLSVLKVDGELDRNVIERLTGPIEHILRNAIDHGLEAEDDRVKNGKPAKGLICLDVFREGSELVIEIKDDGKGIDVESVRKKAEQRGIINADDRVSDEEAMQAIFEPGFSTAGKVTQISGRGVGLDVVTSEIAGMGGSVRVHSKQGEGTLFKLRLPFKVAMSRALLVTAANETFAIPIDSIVGVVRVSSFELEEQYNSDKPRMVYANQEYDFHYLGKLLIGVEPEYNLEQFAALPVLLARMDERLVAIQVDTLLGSREVTVKTLSQKFSSIFGVSGATILGNGKVVTILDLPELVGKKPVTQVRPSSISPDQLVDKKLSDKTAVKAMVVDDSVTVRKVTSRLLERQDIQVKLAKDGQDALELLESSTPDIILLDIEMPRIDGFEVLERMSRDDRLSKIPVIIISSRSGEKHQQRARELGASAFLGKPYQDDYLLEVIARHCPKVADRGASDPWDQQQVING